MNTTRKTALIPSVVGVGNTDLGLLALGGLKRGRPTGQPRQVSWDNRRYLVGENVAQHARTIERMDDQRLANTPENMALTLASLGSVLGEQRSISVSIMVGLPVEVMLKRDLALQTLRGLREMLVGSHSFQVDESEYQVQVDGVQIAAQPAGAYFCWGVNDAGQWTRPAADLDAHTAIADLGFNTLDVLGVQGGQIISRYTGGDTAGIRRAAEILMSDVKQRFEVNLSRHEADRYLRMEKPTLTCWQGDVDLAPICRQALDTAAAGVGDFIETLWGNGRQFRHLLFTGGGAELLRAQLVRRYPHGQVLPDAVIANAIGLARYGRRAFKSAANVIGLDPGFGGFKTVLLQSS